MEKECRRKGGERYKKDKEEKESGLRLKIRNKSFPVEYRHTVFTLVLKSGD
jgi:hypothetical protein